MLIYKDLCVENVAPHRGRWVANIYSDLFPVNLWWLCRWRWPEIDPKDGPQLSHSPDQVGNKYFDTLYYLSWFCHILEKSSPPEWDTAQKAVRHPLDKCKRLITSVCLVTGMKQRLPYQSQVESFVKCNNWITLDILDIKWEDWAAHHHLQSVSIHIQQEEIICAICEYVFQENEICARVWSLLQRNKYIGEEGC